MGFGECINLLRESSTQGGALSVGLRLQSNEPRLPLEPGLTVLTQVVWRSARSSGRTLSADLHGVYAKGQAQVGQGWAHRRFVYDKTVIVYI